MLLSTLYTTFGCYILLLALPDSDFVRIQDFLAIFRTYGLTPRLEFSINLLALLALMVRKVNK